MCGYLTGVIPKFILIKELINKLLSSYPFLSLYLSLLSVTISNLDKP